MRFSGLLRGGLLGMMLLAAFSQTAFASSGGITVLPDSSVIIQIVNFIFLIWILNIIVYKPIRGILQKRKETIDGLEKTIDGCYENAKEQESAWVAGIREARSKGMQEKESLIHAAEEEEKKIVDKINLKASDDLAKLREKISKDVDDVRASLQKEIGAFVDAIGQKILGRNV